MKRALVLILIVTMLLCVSPLTGIFSKNQQTISGSSLLCESAKAATVVKSGTCGITDVTKGIDGSSVTWTLDSDGLLTISGNGDMFNFFENKYVSKISPWKEDETIKSVVIKNGVTSIGNEAFLGCTEITSVSIGRDVSKIGSNAFFGCAGLKSIVIPDSVESIDFSAFNQCTGLTSIEIPNSVKWLGTATFRDCISLTDVTMPEGIQSIPQQMFFGCTKLEHIIIPESVERIGNFAFQGCVLLKSVLIPKNVKTIGDEVFFDCFNLESLTVDDDNDTLYSKDNCIINKNNKTLVVGCKTSIIPADGSVTRIGECAFAGCTQLKKIEIPDSITYIGYRSFKYCVGLTSLTIPNSVTEIIVEAFDGCSGLKQITVSNGNPVFFSKENCIIMKNSPVMVLGCMNSIIPTDGSVTRIAENAFFGCSELKKMAMSQQMVDFNEK